MIRIKKYNSNNSNNRKDITNSISNESVSKNSSFLGHNKLGHNVPKAPYKENSIIHIPGLSQMWKEGYSIIENDRNERNKKTKDTDSLKRNDLNYVARSKSAKKEQRARAVQRSKTVYLNLSKGKNDGALAKLIEDSTNNTFQINMFFKGLWKKKKSIRFTL